MKHLLLLLLAVSLAACEGPVGPAGANGADGSDGAANVEVATISFDQHAFSDGNLAALDVQAWPALDQATVDRGTVLAFLKQGTSHVALPITYGVDTDGDGELNTTVSVSYGYDVNEAASILTADRPMNPNAGPALTYKFVAIAPASNKAMLPTFETYEQLVTYFRL